MKRLLGATAAALMTVALTACVPFGFACSAIGYGTTAHVSLAEPRDDLTLELCDGEDCTPGPAMTPQEIGATDSPVDTQVLEITRSSTRSWTADILGGQPILGYRLTDGEGTVVDEGHVEVEWVRVDGDDRCGGNRVATIVL